MKKQLLSLLLAGASALAPSSLLADKLVTLSGQVENEDSGDTFDYQVSFIYNTAMPIVLVPVGTPDVNGYTGLLDRNWYGVTKAAISDLKINFNGNGWVPGVARNDKASLEPGKFASLWFDLDIANYLGSQIPATFGGVGTTGPGALSFSWGSFAESEGVIGYSSDTFIQIPSTEEFIGFAPENPEVTVAAIAPPGAVPETGSVAALFMGALALLGIVRARRPAVA